LTQSNLVEHDLILSWLDLNLG